MNFKYSLIYYIDMSIINYKNRMIIPLMELESTFGFEVIMNNQIQKRYWTFMKLYRQILLWR
jgi:hypothetical protein